MNVFLSFKKLHWEMEGNDGEYLLPRNEKVFILAHEGS